MGRAPCCDKANVKRGPWSPEEDAVLRSYVESHGTGGNWISLPQRAGLNRCGKSCRLRWLNYLRPDIKHGGFTEEEDNTICTLYNNIGSRWSIIASHLPGRTDNDVKNYWNTKLKKRLMPAQTSIIKLETHINVNNFTLPPNSNELALINSSFVYSLDPQKLLWDLAQFPPLDVHVSPPEASTSSNNGENSSSGGSYGNWWLNGGDEWFMSDQAGFGTPVEELIGGGYMSPQ